MPVINAASITVTLHLRQSLTNLTGAAKVNDVFAVQVVSLENLLTPFKSGDITGAYYLAAFVTCYASISISDLHFSLRFDLLTLSFAAFRDWFIKIQMATGAMLFTKSFAEKIDLIRYMNTLIFLHQVVSTSSEIALNRIGTPLSTIFLALCEPLRTGKLVNFRELFLTLALQRQCFCFDRTLDSILCI
jgi:hypothetical protein